MTLKNDWLTMSIFYSFHQYTKIISSIVMGLFEALFVLALGAFTFYSLAGAFMPYQTLEQNLAYLLLFLACITYWVWLFQTKNEDVSFWESF